MDLTKELANIAMRINDDGCECSNDVLCHTHVVLNRARRMLSITDDLLRQVIIWHYGPAHDQWEDDCVCCSLIEKAGGRNHVIDHACKATEVA